MYNEALVVVVNCTSDVNYVYTLLPCLCNFEEVKNKVKRTEGT